MSAPGAPEVAHLRSALGIVNAHYWRALRRAERAEGDERAAAFEEVHRLTAVGVALRHRADALAAAEGDRPDEAHRPRPSI